MMLLRRARQISSMRSNPIASGEGKRNQPKNSDLMKKDR